MGMEQPGRSLSSERRRFLRVEEAARELQISRTAAYELARRWLVSGRQGGFAGDSVGRSIRIPAAALDRLADPDHSAAS